MCSNLILFVTNGVAFWQEIPAALSSSVAISAESWLSPLKRTGKGELEAGLSVLSTQNTSGRVVHQQPSKEKPGHDDWLISNLPLITIFLIRHSYWSVKVTRGDVPQELHSREGKLSLPPLCLLEAGSTCMVWIKKLGMDLKIFHCPWCLAHGVRPALRHSISPSLAVRETLIYHPSNRHCCWEKHGSAGNGPWHSSRELCRGNYELVLLQATCKGHTGDEFRIFFFPLPLFCLL